MYVQTTLEQYKGGALPHPIIPIVGISAGLLSLLGLAGLFCCVVVVCLVWFVYLFVCLFVCCFGSEFVFCCYCLGLGLGLGLFVFASESAFHLGLFLPWLIVNKFGLPPLIEAAVGAAQTPADRLAALALCCPLVAIVFFAEMIYGVVARTASVKASFSPAGVAAKGQQPFALVQANRIHQNTIENFMIAAPTLAAFALVVDLRTACALVFTWSVGRVAYRVGYWCANLSLFMDVLRKQTI